MQTKTEFLNQCHAMKIGQRLTVFRFHLEDMFSFGQMTQYPTLLDAVLGNLIGSAWGCFTITETIEGPRIVWHIDRNPESAERVYVDPDREDLFIKTRDGTFIPRGR